MPEYACSICQKPVAYGEALPALYPFCSDRCKMIDLGKWFSEEYTIDRDLSPDDVSDMPYDQPNE